MIRPIDFFELDTYKHKRLFDETDLVWDALKDIKGYVRNQLNSNVSRIRGDNDVLLKTLVLYKGEVISEGFKVAPGSPVKGEFSVSLDGDQLKGATVFFAGCSIFDEHIHIGEGCVVEPGALIKGPTIIGDNTEIRQGAYIRGSCLIGDRCIVGHATEMKNSVMIGRVTAGHFAYIGDSILGWDVNLGAGTKLANLSIVGTEINLKIDKKLYKTGLRKFGAVIGDSVETGCNSVTSPGTLLGKRSIVVPNATVPCGYHPPKTIIR